MTARQTRRDFLNGTVAGAVGSLLAMNLPSRVFAQEPTTDKTLAALTAGNSRTENVFNALRLIENQVKKSLARKKRVVIKPNMVTTGNQLAATHIECVRAILEFLKPIVKDEIIIAESPAGQQAEVGYSHYGYYDLQKKYNVKLLNLDTQPYEIRYVVDEHFYPQPVRLSKLLLDPETYIISAAVPKTHDRALVTLALKNVVVGAAIKDKDFRWGKKGTTSKVTIHGGNKNEGINYNLFKLAKILHPHLAVIDGFEGMEGNGPCGGDPVNHKIAVASTDWLAADSMTAKMMGFDLNKIGYLHFAARANLGQADLNKIEILDQKVADHIKKYRPHDKIEQQLKWIKPEKSST